VHLYAGGGAAEVDEQEAGAVVLVGYRGAVQRYGSRPMRAKDL
jgi:hypothetical protein